MSDRKWVLIFLMIAVFSLLGMLAVTFLPSDHHTAVVSVNGKEIKRIDLSQVTESYTFTVKGTSGENTVSVAPGSIQITHATCPDQKCVKHGPLKNSYSPIVCLPNKVTITYLNDHDSIDGVSR